ncbi:helix-turn-helix transcriptional regulator [Algoriphagus persicinus]|uniref:helix-turn-helix transcriptional regulator n=1 Tax=Algoriphagus persicinus TaxID=3108754 RepID=UPI002B389590|nr:WYL domain-containing protein [Algoriphagus sp. E1-3-M2]MEB2786501.1 WYL domain-containing protein [Algoriphagus sp. E1-3-M2]
MSTNKNALIRYKVLDKCFRNPGRRYFIENLIDECNKILFAIDPESKGISRRQIFDDISFMESSEGWEIELSRHRDGKKVFYRYEDLSFSINNMPLNEVEIQNLKESIDILSQFKGMPQFGWISEVIPKLQKGTVTNELAQEWMEFESSEFLKGIDFLGPIVNSLRYKKTLEISYQPYENEEPYSLILHPYFLKQYNGRWFLFGLNPDKGSSSWTLALDRIVEIKEVSIPFIENTQIDWKEYFEDIIGVTKTENQEAQRVVLHFYGKTGHYIETKPLHGSQKSKWLDDQILEVRLEVIPNYELERLILSYADSVKVIQPTAFIELIKNRIFKSLNQY